MSKIKKINYAVRNKIIENEKIKAQWALGGFGDPELYKDDRWLDTVLVRDRVKVSK